MYKHNFWQLINHPVKWILIFLKTFTSKFIVCMCRVEHLSHLNNLKLWTNNIDKSLLATGAFFYCLSFRRWEGIVPFLCQLTIFLLFFFRQSRVGRPISSLSISSTTNYPICVKYPLKFDLWWEFHRHKFLIINKTQNSIAIFPGGTLLNFYFSLTITTTIWATPSMNFVIILLNLKLSFFSTRTIVCIFQWILNLTLF